MIGITHDDSITGLLNASLAGLITQLNRQCMYFFAVRLF